MKATALSIGYRIQRKETKLYQFLDFELQAGSFTALFGSNGVGKSTLLRTLAGWQPPLAGEITLQGTPLGKMSAATLAKQLSMVTTDRLQIGYLKVRDLIAMGRQPYLGFFDQISVQDETVIAQAASLTQIEKLLDKYLNRLSDGERQRVMIARALAQDTPLLLMDEPTAHLDYGHRRAVFQLLRHLSHDVGKTLLVATHEWEIALAVCHQVLWLQEDGKFLFGTAEMVKEEMGRLMI